MLGAQTGIPLSASTEADTLKGAVAKSQVIFKPAPFFSEHVESWVPGLISGR